jgi:hypothetical protein
MKFKIRSTNDVIEFNLISFIFRLFTYNTSAPYRSTLYSFDFYSIREYWLEIGARNSLIKYINTSRNRHVKGYSFREILQKVANSEFGSTAGVVLFDIDLEQIYKFTDRLSGIDNSVLEEDVVFIPASSRKNAYSITQRIPITLGTAYAIDCGLIFYSNKEGYIE